VIYQFNFAPIAFQGRKMKSAAQIVVNQKRASIAWGCAATVIFLCIFYAVPTITNFKYTWQEPISSPGTLISERWGRDFWFIMAFSLMWLVPITALYMIAFPSKYGIVTFHMILSVVLLMGYTSFLIIWAIDYRNANLQQATNSKNPFNDPRWCLVNYGLDGSQCINIVGPTLVLVQDMLTTSATMTFTFWMTFGFWLLLWTDILYIGIVYKRAIGDYKTSVMSLPKASAPNREDVERGEKEQEVNDTGIMPTGVKIPLLAPRRINRHGKR
jgi:hypothetical protein